MIRWLLTLGAVGLIHVNVAAGQGAPIIPPLPTAGEIAEAPGFGADERVLATHYFYWYRWPDEHFFDDPERTDDMLRHHFPDHRDVGYESVAWHKRQMEDMLVAGVDVALCIYWGAPNQYEKADVKFSVRGLPPLVEALDELANEGRCPRVGMFYDTSTLLGKHAFVDPAHGNVDLRTDEGKDIFYRTIRDFFCLVPPRHWACLEGRPIVQLYNSAFAAGHDQSLIDYVYEHFAADFDGRRPFIISGPSWSLKADARTGWGAALSGPILGDGAAQIGPGYDDSPVPGRTTPTRDRLGGGFYAASWLLALQAKPRLVIIETWNELHEGTGICESLEDGRLYLDMTRHYGEIYKAGREPEGADWAGAVRALLSARQSNPSGREYSSKLALGLEVSADGKLVQTGLRLCDGVADGLCEIADVAGVPCLYTRPGVGEHRYLYFDLADPYYYDHRGELRVEFTYYDLGTGEILVQYDSAEETGTPADRYKEHAERITRTDSKTWKTAAVTIRGARCANRQNGGADLRIVSLGSELALKNVTISKLPVDYGK